MTANETLLAAVHPTLADRVRKILSLAAAAGFVLQVTQGLRTFAEQDALFNKRPKVTNARGGQSWHNFGVAADLAFDVNGKISWDDHLYSNIGGWAKAAGLDWGGNWKHFKDLPHVQLPGLPSKPPPATVALFHSGGLAAVWNTFK